MDHQHELFKLLVILTILVSQVCQSWGGWWFSSKKQTSPPEDLFIPCPKPVGAEFALESLDYDEKAMNLIGTAKLQMRTSKSCWLTAYGNLFAGCSKIVSDEDLKDRLTWDLSDCFQKHSGRPSFPYCNPKYPTKNCLKQLDDDAHKDSNLQASDRERLVNELKSSAEYAEEKLQKIEEQGNVLLQNSKHIHASLASIDLQTQHVAETSKNVEDNVSVVKKYSEEVHEQSKGIAASQVELTKGQEKMKERLDEGMTMLHDAYANLGTEITNLKDETIEVEKEIGKVGETMFSRMTTLQNKADDIEDITASSLDKQKQLLDSQSAALEGLQILTTFQSQALEESRDTLQQLSEFGKRQQEELLYRQEQLQRAHNQLAENSKTILTAQEAFESKQARMLNALDKLFALYNALLIESRSIKIFIIYSLLMYVLYMFTSMRQTYSVRPRLYLGLCAAFSIELSVLRCTTCNLEHQAWIVTSTRSLFLFVASLQLLYAIYTYRDYEVLNHQILLALIDKVNGIQSRNNELQWDMDEDSEVNWFSWMDTELPEDVGISEDPDYVLAQEVGENSDQTSSVMKRYYLRSRHR